MKKILLIVFALFSSGLSSTYFYLLRPMPQREGELQFSQLKSEVLVKYDENGIPHLKAESLEDAYFSMGYIIAQHRLFQMDVQRRVATGRLSEILGKKTKELDIMNRQLGFKYFGQVLTNKQAWSEQTGKLAKAYLDGVNHFVATGALPIEFKLLGYRPDPFSLSDVHAFIGYMGFTFQEAIKQEPLLALISERVPPEKAKELMNSYEDDSPSIDKSISKPLEANLPQLKKHFQTTAFFERALSLNENYGYQFDGSNSWIVAAEKSTTGAPLVANDPHIGHSNPGVWFEASIEAEGETLYGHFLSFVPFPILGWTPKHAWTLTMSEIDDMDFFHLTKRGDKFFAGKEPIKVQRVSELVKIKDQDPVSTELIVTPYGIVMDNMLDYGSDEQSLAAYWAYNSLDNQVLEGIRSMALASNLKSFQKAASLATAPGLSISYADISNNIAWFTMGRALKRPPKHNGISIRFPENENGLPSFLNFSRNPHLINPPDHYISTANHRVSNEKVDEFPGYYQPSDRGRRIVDLIERKKKLSPKDFEEMIHDNQDWFFPNIKDLFVESMKIQESNLSSETMNIISSSENAVATTDSRLMPIYRVWTRQVSYHAFIDEFGKENFAHLFKTPVRYNMFKRIMMEENNHWWDDTRTKDYTETREDILRRASADTVVYLKTKLGKNEKKWTWGKLHTIELIHPLGRAKPLNYIFNIGPCPINGGYMILNANSARATWDSFKVVAGPSTRRIIDFSTPYKAKGILPTGNSGHLMDPFYDNQWEDFLNLRLQDRHLGFSRVTKENSFIHFVPEAK